MFSPFLYLSDYFLQLALLATVLFSGDLQYSGLVTFMHGFIIIIICCTVCLALLSFDYTKEGEKIQHLIIDHQSRGSSYKVIKQGGAPNKASRIGKISLKRSII